MSAPGPSVSSPHLVPSTSGFSARRSRSPRSEIEIGRFYPAAGNSETEGWYKSLSFTAKDLLSGTELVEIHGDQKVEAATKVQPSPEQL